jgi:dihydroorotate dehydrogenase
MDKNAVALPGWEALGFGFVEIGTITARAQPGNPRPRLFRYPQFQALVNRMGFNNDGADAVAARLQMLRKKRRWPAIPVGINLGKSKITPLDEAAADYLHSFRALKGFGDYFVINVSSPNTPGLRDLQRTHRLREIIRTLHYEAPDARLLVKIAPDLDEPQVSEIAALAENESLAGLIATNTTLDHSELPSDRDEQGGLSGEPLRREATRLLRILGEQTSLPLIGSGGVMDAASAKEKFDAGARLVQIYTGLVYRGPQLIGEITRLCSELPPS